MSGESVPVEKEPVREINETPLADNPYIYSAEDDKSPVITMYLTVSRGRESENTDHSWTDINGYSIYDYTKMGVERYQVEGLLQIGDETGPIAGELGYGLKIPNATVQVRGATTSRALQKSFKIELKPDAGEWRKQRTIVLNKHIFDGLRFRNKLCYDLMKEIPDMVSMRTQFVHLYVRDDTDGAGRGFADYGLFTQVEQPNGRFLLNHGLDRNGQLYKVNFFEFFRYADSIKMKTDPAFDAEKFENLIEIKGNDDNTKLIAMLDDVNDELQPTEEVFEKYFDADNYFTWLAFNILTGNIDTQSRNYYLYSPLNGNKWYFINWDCDAALLRYETKTTEMDSIGFEYGIANYWGDTLASRVLKVAKYREVLDRKVEELRKIITPQKVYSMADSYKNVVEKYLFAMPDVMHSEYTKLQYEAMLVKFADEIELNYRLYKLSLELPMPFYCDVPALKDGQLTFKWDPSYDFDGEDITYTFELARDYLCKDLVVKKEGLDFPMFTTEMLKSGKYFFRVHAVDEDGKTQIALPYYVFNNVKYYGTQCFYVLADGTVEVEQVHE